LSVASSSRIPIVASAPPTASGNSSSKRKRNDKPNTSSSSTFAIYSDDNDDVEASREPKRATSSIGNLKNIPPPYSQWRVLPPEHERCKENISIPTTWANQKLVLAPTKGTTAPSNPSFKIFSDDDEPAQQSQPQPPAVAQKPVVTMPSSKPSGSRSSSSSAASKRTTSSRSAPNEKLGYNAKLLQGVDPDTNKNVEFSFEEQRALLPKYFFDPKILSQADIEDVDMDVDMEVDEEEDAPALEVRSNNSPALSSVSSSTSSFLPPPTSFMNSPLGAPKSAGASASFTIFAEDDPSLHQIIEKVVDSRNQENKGSVCIKLSFDNCD